MSSFGYWDMTIITVAVIAYIVVTSMLSLWLRRSKTNEQFMVASRALPTTVVGAVMMSEVVASAATVGSAQQAFKSGMAAAIGILGCAIALPIFGVVVAGRMYGTGEYTISGIVAKRYGQTARLIVSGISLYAMFILVVSAYLGGASALSVVYKIPLIWAALITALVSTSYYAFGGLKGAAPVMMIHLVAKYACVIVIVAVALKMAGGFTPIYHALPHYYWTWDGKIGPSTMFGWTFAWVGAMFATQHVVQTMSAARSAAEAKRASIYAGLWCVPIGLMAAFIGVAARYLFPKMNPLYALPVFIQHMNPFLGAIATIGIAAGVFGGVAAACLGMTTLAVKDFVVPILKLPPEKQLKVTRYVGFVIGFLPVPIVLTVQSILKTAFFARSLRVSIAIVAVCGFFLPAFSTGTGACIGLLGAVVGASIWFFSGNPYGIDPTYVAAVIPLVVMVIDHLVRRIARPQVRAAAAGSGSQQD